MSNGNIQAGIGAWHKDGRTFYVKRSGQMENYPNVWSLFSIQFTDEELPDYQDKEDSSKVMNRMSQERLGGEPIQLIRYIKSATCYENPMNIPVTLHLYQIELEQKPKLNPRYYADSAWFTPEEYLEASAESTCGLCLRMWSDYCYQMNLSKIRFAPSVDEKSRAR